MSNNWEIIEEVHVLSVGESISADGIETFHTRDDLEELAKTYNPKIHEASCVLGHDQDTDWSKLMNRNDSQPSYGWVNRAYVKGNDLFLDIDASPELKKYLDNKYYKKRSLGYYSRKSKSNPVPGKLYIRHLAMLGASPPAIKGLEDITLAESKKMATNDEVKQLLDQNSENWLAAILKDDGNIINDTIVAFDPKPEESNNWLFNIEQNKWKGSFITDTEERFLFEIIQQGEGDFVVSAKPEVSDEEEPVEQTEETATADLETDEQNPEPEQIFGESKMPQIVKEKTTTEKEYMEDKTYMEDEMKMRDDGHVDPDEEKAGMDSPRSEVDAVKDTEMAEMKECGEKEYADTEEAVAEEPVVEEAVAEEPVVEEETLMEPMEMAEEDIEAMKEELAMLRAKVKKQEEAKMKQTEDEMIRFTENLYTENKILDTQYPQDKLISLFKGLLSLGNEHMVYSEGEEKVSVMEEFKNVLDSLPKQVEDKVKLAEGLVAASPSKNAVKYQPGFTKESQEIHQMIHAKMKEQNIPLTDRHAYIQIYSQVKREKGLL